MKYGEIYGDLLIYTNVGRKIMVGMWSVGKKGFFLKKSKTTCV